MWLLWGSVMFLFVFLNSQLNNCFGKISVVLRRIFESAVEWTFYSSDPEKDLLEWLEELQRFDMGHLV